MKKYEEFLDIFSEGTPDFQKAETMLKNGLDINYNMSQVSDGGFNNLLAEIICCMDMDTPPCLCKTIQFFFSHGFDVHMDNNNYGRECLSSLAFSTYDKQIIAAAKLLLDAGAKITDENGELDYEDSPIHAIDIEGSYQNTCENNYHCGNLFKAVYQIFEAVIDGKAYDKIDTYENAIGEKIEKVYAECEGDTVFFDVKEGEYFQNNCYSAKMYYKYGDMALVTTQYGDFWTDRFPQNKKLKDITDKFEKILYSPIKNIYFDHNKIVKGHTVFGQPITYIEFENGRKIKTGINFGEVNDENRAAYYEIID